MGGGAVTPVAGKDKIGGNIIVEVAPSATTFTVTYSGNSVDMYDVWNPVAASNHFAWSKHSSVYHFASCSYVSNISPSNLETGTTPPPAKHLHIGCPK